MTFAVRWSRQAERFLGKLPWQIAHRIVGKVNSMIEHPLHFLEHHQGPDFFKLRVGSYRLLVDIDLRTSTIPMPSCAPESGASG